MIKFYGAKVLHDVVDRALQVHGSLGYSTDLPLEAMYRFARAARIYDGPDEVHRAVGRPPGPARLRGAAGRASQRARADPARGGPAPVRRPARGRDRERLMSRRVRLGLLLALVAVAVGAARPIGLRSAHGTCAPCRPHRSNTGPRSPTLRRTTAGPSEARTSGSRVTARSRRRLARGRRSRRRSSPLPLGFRS